MDKSEKADAKTFAPLRLSRAEWDSFKRNHLLTADKRATTRQAWHQYEEERRKRWEDAGYIIDWKR